MEKIGGTVGPMGQIEGRFLADLLLNGNVQMQFVPNAMDGRSRPLLAKNIPDAESDFISFFEFTPAKAAAHIAELGQNRHIDAVITIDEAKLPSLFQAA